MASTSAQRHTYRAVFHQTHLSTEDLLWLQGVIEERPLSTLKELAHLLCGRFGWRRPNGLPPLASCSVFLRQLGRHGLIRLPRPLKPRRTSDRLRHRNVDRDAILEFLGTVPGSVDTMPSGPLTIRPIAPEEYLGFRLHLQKYHYLGFKKPTGESLAYVALLGEEMVALLLWGAAALRNAPRDSYIGWDAHTKTQRLAFVVNNQRFLILPWIRQPGLASRVLAANLRRLPRDWERVYCHPLLLAETFVDSTRFRGTCYRAANWIYLGQTRGFSRTKTGYMPNHRPKAVFVYPLHRHACRLLATGGPA